MTLIGQLGYGIESYRLRGSVTPTLGYAGQHGGGATLRFGADYAANPQWLGLDLAIGFGLQRRRDARRGRLERGPARNDALVRRGRCPPFQGRRLSARPR